MKSISDPEMEAIMRTVSEKPEWKKRLRTDGQTNKRYSIRDRHDENLGNKGEKTVIKSFN